METMSEYLDIIIKLRLNNGDKYKYSDNVKLKDLENTKLLIDFCLNLVKIWEIL